MDYTAQANELFNYEFTPEGTLDKQTDGEGIVTNYTYDTLKRLISTTRDLGGTGATADTLTQYGYDVHNHLTKVTDPNNNDTTYVYDDLGNLLSQTSPDTGTTIFSYDQVGNIKTRTDAKGQTFTYQYDAANRLLSIDTVGVDDDISYSYDTCTNGIGKLCSASLGTASVDYSYTPFGEIAVYQGMGYSYDFAGRVKSINYASGTVVNYYYDSAGQVSRIDATIDGVTTTVANAISYAPFGPVKSFTYGNGKVMNGVFDTAYRTSQLTTSGVLELDYSVYDNNGNITTLIDSLANNTQTFAYDPLNRLNGANDAVFEQQFGYDRNGNRLQLTDGGVSTDYSYEPASNRITQVGSDIYATDANGNTLSDGSNTYSYTAYNRLATINTDITYRYNALGQRIAKIVNGEEIRFNYDTAGKLLAEQAADGSPLKDYIYLGDKPVAVYSHQQATTTPIDAIIDNADASFVGDWPASTNNTGFIGSDYQYIVPGSGTSQTPVLTVDNGDPGTSTTGSWPVSSFTAGFIGTDSAYHAAGTGQEVYTWSIAVQTAGEYQVYARWTSHTNRASDATYTINHVNGVDNVTVNQQINGGSWQLLGTFTLDANSQVSLSDAANGYVIADAVQVVTQSGQPNTATWPTAVSTGDFEVFAIWTSHTNRPPNAIYTVNHTGGSTPVVVNQQVNGGSWQLLGLFNLDMQSNVQLAQSADGYAIADAIRIVGQTQTTTAGALHYIHTDHLGTPRAVSDTTGTVVWQWNSDPFGKTAANDDPDGDGNAFEMNLRFPGQYYDNETGLHYNHMRYYDPSTGRYLTSDPIGLAGGLNSYSYVLNNPLKWTDVLGLIPSCWDGVKSITSDYNERTQKDLIFSQRYLFPSPSGAKVDLDLDPWNPGKPPVKPGIGFDIWLAEHRQYRIQTYLQQIITETFKRYCTETRQDECGNDYTEKWEYQVTNEKMKEILRGEYFESEDVLIKLLYSL